MSRNGSKTPTRTIKIYENQVFVKDFDSSAKVTYKLAGKDAKLFTVDGSGRLKFKSAPDFETPRDSGRDNVYNVTLIRDSDRKIREPERENIRIEVRDKNEKSKDKGSIGDRVWFDKDGDGIQDRGEAGVAGVTVKLLSTGGKTLATTKTDANGKYLFDDLKPGSYKVKFTAPDGHEFTKRSTSNPEKSGKDSDATSSGKTYTVKLSKGEKQTKVDAGLVKGDPCDASIGDTVFLDTDGDGRRDSGEAGVAGVTVQLLTSGGKLIESTTTSASGKYLFDDLPAGNYRVKFIAPDGTEFTKRSTVGPEAANNDSDANTSTGITGVIKLSESERQKKIDAGLVKTDSGDASIGDTVWFDTNGDGLLNNGESGAEGMLVGLLDSAGNVVLNTTTNAAGGYIFEDLDAGVYAVRFTAPDGYEFTTASGDDADATNNDSDADEATGETGTVTISIGEAERDVDAGLVETDSGTASLGDTVWIDTDGDGELNNGETGAAGVTVELLGAGGVVDTTTTDANGRYLFDNLDADDYRVRFTAPDGYEFTTASGDDADAANNDSDADEATGETGTVTLSIGEAERDVDAGLVETDSGTASLGDTVWIDTDGDGELNNGESGAAGVTVELLGAGGAVVDTTTTDANGGYLFDNLDADDYRVRFTAPDGYEFTTASGDHADATNNDSDADEATGETGTVTLSIGEAERDVDAGLVETDSGTASLGDTVWYDTDGNGNRDGGENGAAGVTVELLGDGGAVLATTTTDANGQYLFSNLSADDYRVRFGTLTGFTFTAASAAAAAAANDDSDADMTTGETGTITLGIGQTELDIDAGLVSENGAPVAADDEVEVCVDTVASVNVLANDSDPDGATLTVTEVDGQTISEGQTIAASDGVRITLNGGELSFDPSGTAYANLVIGAHEEVSYSYTVSDGTASATADVDVEYCGAVNTLETIAASLPSTGTISVSDDNSPGGVYYTTTISGTGDDRLDGKSFDIAYCLVQADVLYFEVDIPADIYLADESSIPSGALAKPEHLDLVNWIINQGFENMDNGDGTGATYTEAEIQGAIWGLLDDLNWVPPGTGTRENATEIMELAQANGEGFTPGEGDVVGLFLLPTDAATPEDNDQASIIGVRFEDLAQDCFCL